MLSFSLVAEALTGLIYHRPSGENSKFLFSFLSMRMGSHMKHSFHVFHHGLKTFERDKRLGVHLFLMFSYHDETLELVFHILLKTVLHDA